MRGASSEKTPQSVLVVSSNEKSTDFICLLLDPSFYYPVKKAGSAGEAVRLLSDNDFGLVIINTPLKDEFGTELALDITEKYSSAVLLLVQSDIYDSVSFSAENEGILCVSKPVTKDFFARALRLAFATGRRIERMEKKTATLREKMEEIRIVNRAKWLLIEKKSMNEKEAHKYIEKRSMDLCIKKKETAERIIEAFRD